MSLSEVASQQQTFTKLKTRKALNDLQYSPNGKTIVNGLAPMKVNNLKNKMIFNEPENVYKEKCSYFKKRTSISLPDICSMAQQQLNQSVNRSITSTPNKFKQVSTSSLNTPSKLSAAGSSRNKDFSIIIEEKENPSVLFNLSEKLNEIKTKSKSPQNEEREKLPPVECREVEIQCNKMEEDMLTGESVENTSYWKLLAYKRYKSVLEASKENENLNKAIADLDKRNEELKMKNANLLKVIEEYEEIKQSILESIDCDDEYEENDSGYQKE